MKHVKRIILITFSFFFIPGVSAANDLVAGKKCSYFSGLQEMDARVSVPAGPISLVSNQGGRKIGYEPDKTYSDTANRREYVYDCDRSYTANGLLVIFSNKLSKQGFEVEFTCLGAECGPPKGWVEYLGLQATPEKESFGYFLAQKRVQTGVLSFSVYVADIDKRPRVVLNKLSAIYTDVGKADFDKKAIQPIYSNNNARLMTTLFFDSGSSKVSDIVDDKFISEAEADGSYWVIIGHSDSQGRTATNQTLSWERALVAEKWLRSKLGDVLNQKIKLFAVGSSQPIINASASSDQLINSRRAEIFLVGEPGGF